MPLVDEIEDDDEDDEMEDLGFIERIQTRFVKGLVKISKIGRSLNLFYKFLDWR